MELASQCTVLNVLWIEPKWLGAFVMVLMNVTVR
jgi:hypothetical protein